MVELYDPVDPASVMGLPAESHCRLCGAAWRAVVYPGPANTTGRPRVPGRRAVPGLRPHPRRRLPRRALLHPLRLPRATRDRLPRRRPARPGDARRRPRPLRRRGARPRRARLRGAQFRGGQRRRRARPARGGGARGDQLRRGVCPLSRRARGLVGGARGAGPETTAARPAATPNGYDPRAILHALVSVLAADGRHDPRETAFLDRFLADGEARPAARPTRCRVHRPDGGGRAHPPARRARCSSS